MRIYLPTSAPPADARQLAPSPETLRGLGLPYSVTGGPEFFDRREKTGIENGKIIGRLLPTGLRPKFIDRIEASGIRLPPNIFGIGTRGRY